MKRLILTKINNCIMKKVFLLISVTLLIVSGGCSQSKKAEFLTLVCEKNDDSKCGYEDSNRKIVIPIGKYSYCYTDTLKDFAVVMDKNNRCIAIDINENELFEVYWYDNGPDYLSEGFFRIKKDDKIGYANEKGEIIIKPQYKCAFPFEDGKAKVALDCSYEQMGEHQAVQSNKWFYIDKSGTKVGDAKDENQPVMETIEGSFESLKGVMKDLSCYCFNCGYITTSSGEEIPVCFENDEIKVNCSNIIAKGFYKEESIEPDNNSPCSAGKMRIFYIDTFECKE